jgi:hypothetical protein
MGGIYEVRRSDRLRCHETHTKFYADWFRHTETQRLSLKPTFIFSIQGKQTTLREENRLKVFGNGVLRLFGPK